MDIRSKLVHCVTEYDKRQSKGKRYNVYALGQYLIAIDAIEEEVDTGEKTVEEAIKDHFYEPLQSKLLKAIL